MGENGTYNTYTIELPAPRLDQIRNVVREELLGTVGPGDVRPPPCAVAYEADVLNAILCGIVKHSDLPHLAASHFFTDMYGRIYDAARSTLEPEAIALAAFEAGVRGGERSMTQVLATLKVLPDWTDTKVVRSKSERIVELAHRRVMIRDLNRLVGDLRHDRCSTEDARAAMSRL